jgi:hypothetical protein
MATVRVLEADPKLPHQIVFRAFGPDGSSGVQVTCNCRVRRGESALGGIGKGRTAWEIYQTGPHHTAEGPFDRLVTGDQKIYALT